MRALALRVLANRRRLWPESRACLGKAWSSPARFPDARARSWRCNRGCCFLSRFCPTQTRGQLTVTRNGQRVPGRGGVQGRPSREPRPSSVTSHLLGRGHLVDTLTPFSLQARPSGGTF